MELAALGAALLPSFTHAGVRALAQFLLLRPRLYRAWLQLMPKVDVRKLDAKRLRPFVERGLDLMWRIDGRERVFARVELQISETLRVALYTPPSRNPNKPTICIVHAHQGGFFYGGLAVAGEEGFINLTFGRLCGLFDVVVVDVDFRFEFAASVCDVQTAVRWVHANAQLLGIDRAQIYVCGESSGACIAASVAQSERALLRGQLLIIPLLDNSGAFLSNDLDGHGLDADFVRWCSSLYTHGDASTAQDPLCSPLLSAAADLRSLPPTLIVTNTCDVLRAQAAAYSLKLCAEQVSVTIVELPAVHHTSLAIPSLLHESFEAFFVQNTRITHARL
jgi:acetyl esterase/lipase